MHFRYHKRSFYLLGLVALVGMVAHATLYYYFHHNVKSTPVVTLPPAAVDTGPATDPTLNEAMYSNTALTDLTGVITLTATDGANELVGYQYDIVADTVAPVIPGVPMVHAVVGQWLAAAVIQNDDTTRPAWINYETGEYGFVTSPDYALERDVAGNALENAIAYSATNNDTSDTWYELDNWDVVINVPPTGYTKIIENAAHPQWLIADETLVYLKTDGIYHYDLTTDTETRLIDDYSNLSFYDDIAASFYDTEEGGATLVLTMPSLGLVNTYYFTDETSLAAVARYQTDDALYTAPVVYQEGQLFAVVELNQTTPSVTVFSAGSGQPVVTKAIPDMDASSNVTLDGWFTDVRPFTSS
jgi:hypothetical protein